MVPTLAPVGKRFTLPAADAVAGTASEQQRDQCEEEGAVGESHRLGSVLPGGREASPGEGVG